LPKTLHHARAEVAGRRAQIGRLFSRLKEVSAPVTILHGDVDHLVSMGDARTLRGYFAKDADVEFRHVRGGTHFLEMQFPKQVYEAVNGVIGRANGDLGGENRRAGVASGQ
jgi:pimeloyl-ACP methyl ester carboxylesterase